MTGTLSRDTSTGTGTSAHVDERLGAEARDFLARPHRLLIGGQWVDAADGRTFGTYDPATGAEITRVAHGGPEDVDRAVAAARRTFDDGAWATMKPREREQILWRIGDLLDAKAELFGQIEALDNGKSVGIATAVDVAWAADVFRYYAGWATKIEGSTVNVSMPFAGDKQFHAYTQRVPVGVCGQIIPWNFPLLMAAWKLGPALATGNTLVLKPAEQTPLTALLLGEVCQEAGVPDGVVNIITGFGDAGAAISGHDDVDKVAFTGSTEVGKLIVDAAKGNLKKVSLELGGKSANIVFADCDWDAAVAGSVAAWMFNHGQACTAGTRLYVEDSIYDEFTQAVADAAAQATIGHGLDPDTVLGPVVDQDQFDKVSYYLRAGIEDGGRALTGGARHGDTGFFIQPTVFVDVKPEDRVVKEEIFGPVVSALRFTDVDDAVRQANDSMYGLAAGVWTKDLSKAHQVASRLQAGSVWVNQYNGFDTAMPFGGFKQSGWGRELGAGALDLYTQTRSVNIQL
ncbi:aldehyde dehydrogenase family protein [Dietzia cinnamea]|uniref:aldehyde dehydrogenase family protein n=1 Tax=Dietzia cinnamea TaxID=321318 RepID=UPI0021A89C4E|nr:aldehyde dehydrogenase family protein [Dietzia cinnamea]MCT2098786.1 aldehyde dehydrogenase family protein [Dietzia cinnamea]